MKTKYLPAMLGVAFLFGAGCQKSENTSSRSSNDDLRTQLMNSTNVLLQSGDFDGSPSLGFGTASGTVSVDNATASTAACKTITNDPSADVYPHTRTIVLNGCTTCDGYSVSGTKVTVFYVDPATASPGDLLSEETYSDLVVDGSTVSADTKTYLVSTSPLVLHVVSTKSVIQSGSDGGKRDYTSDRAWTRTAGDATADESDDVYSITGTETGKEVLHGGTVANDVTSVIDNPLIRANSCCHFTQGSQTITITGKTHGGFTVTEVLDYGAGTCDNAATLSIDGGAPQNVTIPLRFYPIP